MTRARIRTSGLGNPPRPQHWLVAALCAFVSLVTKLFQFRRTPIGPPGSRPAVDAQRRDHRTPRHPLRLARKSERSTSPSRVATEGGKKRRRFASLTCNASGVGGMRALARMTKGVSPQRDSSRHSGCHSGRTLACEPEPRGGLRKRLNTSPLGSGSPRLRAPAGMTAALHP